MNVPLSRLLLAVICLVPALASGSGFGGFGGFSGPRSSDSQGSDGGSFSSLDQKYELGRSIVAQQASRYQDSVLCLAVDGKFHLLLDVKVPDLMAYGKRQALAAALHDCAREPQQPLNTIMRPRDLEALVYFLDRRLDLKLAL